MRVSIGDLQRLVASRVGVIGSHELPSIGSGEPTQTFYNSNKHSLKNIKIHFVSVFSLSACVYVCRV